MKKGKKKMKLWKKILLIILGVIVVGTAAVAVWQRDNLKALYYFMKADSKDEISKQIESEKKEREKIISEYTGVSVRDFTDEEEQKIISGSMTVEEATKLIREDYEKSKEVKAASVKPANSGSKGNSAEKNAEISDMVADNVIQLYSYKAYYLGQLGQIEKAAIADYEKLSSAEKTLVNKQNIVSRYIGKANALLSECDGKVNSVMDKLKTQLEKNGMETSIIGEISSSYENEKALKKAYYMSLVKE